MHEFDIGALTVSNDLPLLVIAGPCQLEGIDHAQMIAGKMAEVCAAHGAQFTTRPTAHHWAANAALAWTKD